MFRKGDAQNPERSASEGRMMTRTILTTVLAFALAGGLQAQWLNYPDPRIVRLPDGKPNLFAPAPRAGDGKPDLSGVWLHEVTSADELKRLFGKVIEDAIRVEVPGMEIGTQHKYGLNLLLDYKPENAMLRPAAAPLMQRNRAQQNPADLCANVPGFPMAGLLAPPIKIVQASYLTTVFYEVGNVYRQIYTDGRKLPNEYSLPAYLGYSVGRWEDDTFIVDTAGFNDKTVLDYFGHPHSESLHVLERFRRQDFGHMTVEMTFTDPEIYSRPFTVSIGHNLLTNGDIFESFCENEKSRVHMVKP
jgi:hypothetical protein